jgi:flagellar L-ring protein FlgH
MQYSPFTRLSTVALLLAGASLSGCNLATRLSQVGEAPALTPITNPTLDPRYQPVSLPMPAPQPNEYAANSLWRAGARAFFKDQRANQVGDLLTINISISDQASFSNTTSRTRSSSEGFGIDNFFGLEGQINRVLPDAADTGALVGFGNDSSHTGDGSIDRSESLDLNVAALITQVLQNGNLVVEGRQEVRVNFEVRELYLTGIVRPSDILSNNSISFEKVAEARIAYGGRGQITDMQQPRYGQQVMDAVLPF